LILNDLCRFHCLNFDVVFLLRPINSAIEQSAHVGWIRAGADCRAEMRTPVDAVDSTESAAPTLK
jgi:hypothetical protein